MIIFQNTPFLPHNLTNLQNRLINNIIIHKNYKGNHDLQNHFPLHQRYHTNQTLNHYLNLEYSHQNHLKIKNYHFHDPPQFPKYLFL